MPISGSCHCGRVKFEFEGEPTSGVSCNCSICRRKGTLLHFVAAPAFALTTPEDELTVYTFNKHVIAHAFCKTCGCTTFARGAMPDGTPMVAINLRCLDDFDLKALTI